MDNLAALAAVIGRHTGHDGIFDTAVPGLGLIRAAAPTMPMPVVYQPTLCVVAQGRKQVALGTSTYVYDAATCLVASVDLAVMGSVIEASREAPYLSLRIDLDMAQLADLAIRHPGQVDEGAAPGPGIALTGPTPALLDAVLRLTALLDAPHDIDALAPLILREISYRLLADPAVRAMAQGSSRLNQIARAILWLREHYNEACTVDELAEEACMSRSAFHAHFKAVTLMSPIEFRNHLRLQEARRLMLAEALDAASAGFRVGYESPSQFSRDYRQMFGAPPATDVGRLRLA